MIEHVFSLGFFKLEKARITASITISLMWIKLLYWIRLHKATSYYTRLILETLRDIKPFIVVYLIVLGMFANAMHCLNMNRDTLNEDSTVIERHMKNIVWDAMLNQYLLSLGEFNTDNFANGFDDWTMMWIFFILSTFLT